MINLTHRRKNIILGLVIVYLLVMVRHNFQERPETGILDTTVTYLAYPIQRPMELFFEKIGELWIEIIRLTRLRSENEILRHKVKTLIQSKNIYYELAFANKRLRKMLDFKKTVEHNLIPVEIIGRDATNWYQSILINKGSNDGIGVNMPVVTYGGLIGRVLETTGHIAKVQLLLDQSNRVGVMIQRTRSVGILRGHDTNDCSIFYLDRNDDIQKGDRVITSGLGGIYPKGLMVGEVSSVKVSEADLFAEVKLDTAVDFFKLEEIFILTKEFNPEILELSK